MNNFFGSSKSISRKSRPDDESPLVINWANTYSCPQPPQRLSRPQQHSSDVLAGLGNGYHDHEFYRDRSPVRSRRREDTPRPSPEDERQRRDFARHPRRTVHAPEDAFAGLDPSLNRLWMAGVVRNGRGRLLQRDEVNGGGSPQLGYQRRRSASPRREGMMGPPLGRRTGRGRDRTGDELADRVRGLRLRDSDETARRTSTRVSQRHNDGEELANRVRRIRLRDDEEARIAARRKGW